MKTGENRKFGITKFTPVSPGICKKCDMSENTYAFFYFCKKKKINILCWVNKEGWLILKWKVTVSECDGETTKICIFIKNELFSFNFEYTKYLILKMINYL